MLEIVAFDFDHELLTYRDGRVSIHTPYHYDAMQETYSFEPLLPVVRELAPDAPIYHLPHEFFVRAVERVEKWGYGMVLELAREHRL